MITPSFRCPELLVVGFGGLVVQSYARMLMSMRAVGRLYRLSIPTAPQHRYDLIR